MKSDKWITIFAHLLPILCIIAIVYFYFTEYKVEKGERELKQILCQNNNLTYGNNIPVLQYKEGFCYKNFSNGYIIVKIEEVCDGLCTYQLAKA